VRRERSVPVNAFDILGMERITMHIGRRLSVPCIDRFDA